MLAPFNLLVSDFRLYKPDSPCLSAASAFLAIIGAFCKCRDFRLNVFIRLQSSRIFLLSRICHSLIFYLYGSTIHPGAKLHAPLRFVHARNIVIGKHVSMTGDYAVCFHGVTLGKLRPGSPSTACSMPTFTGSVVFGSSSTILGDVTVGDRVVFGANCFCTLTTVPPCSTVVSFNRLISGVYFGDQGAPDFQPAF